MNLELFIVIVWIIGMIFFIWVVYWFLDNYGKKERELHKLRCKRCHELMNWNQAHICNGPIKKFKLESKSPLLIQEITTDIPKEEIKKVLSKGVRIQRR